MRALSALVALCGVASAEPIATVQSQPSDPRGTSPATPSEPPAPRSDRASGVAVADTAPAAKRLLWIPRGLLFFPRIAVWAVGQPIRAGAYAYEHYDLPGRFRKTFFNVDGTFGIYPVAAYDSGFGFTAGARLVHRDLFGEGERVKLRVDVGGRYRQAYGVNARSGTRLGRVAIELDSSFERRPNERFYGIGNGDEVDVRPPLPLDPAMPEVAIATRFREDLVRNVVGVDTQITSDLHARTSGAVMLRQFAGSGGDDNIESNFQTDRLVGFQGGVRNVYVEQELAYDSRRPASIYASDALDGTGWLASIHVGLTRGIDGDRSSFLTYGGELQRYFDLYRGTRILALRAMVEAVKGDDDEIAFTDLPRLGGSDFLRGYPNARFRDRAIALTTAEYTWDLGNFLAAYMFVDVGRPFHSLRDLDVANLRLGYGGGIQVHTPRSFLIRAQLAASREGDVVFELALSPSFGRRERAGRF